MARNFAAGTNMIKGALSSLTSSPVSISVMARTAVDPTTNDFCIIQLQNDAVADEYIRLNVGSTASSGELGYRVSDGSGGAENGQSGTVAVIGTWYHVGFTEYNSGDDRTFYLDGASTVGTANLVTPTFNSYSIGREGDSSPADSWNGDIAEVGIWDVQLTDAEFAILAAGYSPLFVRPQSLIRYNDLIRPALELMNGTTMTITGTTVAAHPRIRRPYSLSVPSFTVAAPGGGRIMSSLVSAGGLAGQGGIAGKGGGLAG